MSDDRPVQHTPKHLQADSGVFDPRHPAASAFAVAQPGAGVVADDVEEKGQNQGGGPTASDAAGTFSDQREVLAKQHEDNLKAASGGPAAPSPVVDGDSAKAASSAGSGDRSPAKPTGSTAPAAAPAAPKN